MKRLLLSFFFVFLLSVLVLPQFQKTFAAERCEVNILGCDDPGSMCPIAIPGTCDDANNKNYVCAKFAGFSFPRCTARWECTCVNKGKTGQMKCTTRGYQATQTLTQTFSCKSNQVCADDPSSTFETDVVKNDAGEYLAGVECINGTGVPGTVQNLPQQPAPCAKYDSKGSCVSVSTSLGNFDTDPGKFIGRVFGVLLAISGAMAVILIMRAGYQIMTARGNPEGLQKGREQIVAAIVGLMFLIFSFVLLQTLSVDILRIPGFGGPSGGVVAKSCVKDGKGACAPRGACLADGGKSIGQYDCSSSYTCCKF